MNIEQTTLRDSPRTRRKFYNYLVLMFNTAFEALYFPDMCISTDLILYLL